MKLQRTIYLLLRQSLMLFITGALFLAGGGTLYAQNYLIDENISGWEELAQVGNTTRSVTVLGAGAQDVDLFQCAVQPAAVASGVGTTGRVVMAVTNGVVTLPQVPSSGDVIFNLSSQSTGVTVVLQKMNESVWDDLYTFTDIGTSVEEFIYSVDLETAHQFRLKSATDTLYIYDIKVEEHDVTLPLWTSGYPVLANGDVHSVDVQVNLNEPGIGYVVAVLDGSVSPTSEQVKAGKDASGNNVAVGLSNSVPIVNANSDYVCSLSNLALNTAYDIYVVAADDAQPQNLQAAPVQLDFQTAQSSSESVIVQEGAGVNLSSVENATVINAVSDGSNAWELKLYDGDGATNDNDALPTIYNGFTFTQGAGNMVADWTSIIEAVGVFNSSDTKIGSGIVNANSIVFSGLDINIADGSSNYELLKLVISLKTVVTDEAKLELQLMPADVSVADASVSSQLSSSLSPLTNLKIVDVTATKLVYGVNTSNVLVSEAMVPAVVVKAIDINGNVDRTFGGDDFKVNVSTTGIWDEAATHTAIIAYSGIISLNNLRFSAIQSDVTITVDDASKSLASTGASDPFDVISQVNLVISQYVENSGAQTPKGIEIFNNSGGNIDFGATNLDILLSEDGEKDWSVVTTISSGILADQEVMVVGSSGIQTYLTNQGLTSVQFENVGFAFNGDDALALRLDGAIVDVMGAMGSDPGLAWTGNGVSTRGQNIARKTGSATGDPDGWNDPSTLFYKVNGEGDLDLTGFGVWLTNDVDSRITAPTTQITGGDISSMAVNSASKVDIMSIKIEDLGSNDGLSTTVTKIRVKPGDNNNVDWTDAIQAIELGGVTLDLVDITDNYIDLNISNENLVVNDASSAEYTLSMWLNTSGIVDNSVLEMKIDTTDHGCVASTTGSSFATSFPAVVSSEQRNIVVVSTHLAVEVQPTDVRIGEVMSPAVEIKYTDFYGNIDLDANGEGYTVELTASASSFPGDVKPTADAVSGICTFDNMVMNSTGTGVTFTAESLSPTGLNDAITSTFDVTDDNSSLIIVPDNQIVAGNISSLADSEGEAVSVFSFKIVDGGSDGKPTLVDNIHIQPGINNDIDWTTVIQGVVLDAGGAVSIGTPVITNTSIDIPVPAGLSVDEGGTVTVTLKVYVNNSGITDAGKLDFKITAADHGCTTLGSGSGFDTNFTSDVSSEIQTLEVIATELRMSVEPSDVAVNAVMLPDMVIHYTDANGNLDLNADSDQFTVEVTANSSAFAGSATTVVDAVAGVCTFSNIVMSTPATGVTLTAAHLDAGIITGVTTAAFDVTNVATSKILVADNPIGAQNISSLIDTEGEALNVFRFKVKDFGGDVLPTDVSNIRLKPGSGNTAGWLATIGGVKLINGTEVLIGSVTITDELIDIPISAGNLLISDGSSVEVTLAVYLTTNGIADGDVLSFMIDGDDHGCTAYNTGSDFVTDFGSDISSADQTLEVIATTIEIAQQPGDVLRDVVMTPAVLVNFVDENSNVDINVSDNVNLSVAGSSFSGGAVTSNSAISGVVTFDNLIFNATASTATITATSQTDGWSVVSESFAVLNPVLIISQYVTESGNSIKRGLELWNRSGYTLDFALNNLVIETYADGGNTIENTYTLSSGTLADGAVMVIGSAAVVAEAPGGVLTDTYAFTFNGDNAIQVKIGDAPVDKFGQTGGDPGVAWTGGTVSTVGQNLALRGGFDSGSTGWTDPSQRFYTVAGENIPLTGFGIAPAESSEPTNHVTDFAAISNSYSSVDFTWTDAVGDVLPDKYVIKGSTVGFDDIVDPVDETPENEGGLVKIVDYGSEAAVINSLTENTSYYFKIYPYSTIGSIIYDYKLDGVVPQVSVTTPGQPALLPLIISEVASPNNAANARFVELYNAGDQTIDFSAETYYIAIQQDGATWSSIQLIGSLLPGNTHVIANNESGFVEAYTGKGAQQYNPLFNGDGNDVYALYHGGDHLTGDLVDIYGVGDVNGTGEVWEYTNGHAVRNFDILEPNTSWSAGEWTITSGGTGIMTPCEHGPSGGTQWIGGTSSDWTIASNWDNGVPSALSDVTITNGTYQPTVAGDVICKTMTINSGAVITIEATASLNVVSTLINNNGTSGIVIQSTASATGRLVNASSGVQGEMQLHMTPSVYHYISSPMTDASYSNIQVPGGTPGTDYDFFWYNESAQAQWVYLGNSAGTFVSGRGYAFAYTKDGNNYVPSFTGTFKQGNTSIAVSQQSGGEPYYNGWNIVGNPYPSAISAKTSDASNFLAQNSSIIMGTLYFWDEGGSSFLTSDYATWNGTGGVSGGGGQSPNGLIAPGQAFQVYKLTVGSGNVNFTNSMRQTGSSSFFKNGTKGDQDIWRFKMGVTSEDNNYNETLVGFLEGATEGKDNLYDGMKLTGSEDIALYTLLDDEQMAIQGLPLIMNHQFVVPMGVYSKDGGSYTFDVKSLENFDDESSVILEDKLENKTYTLNVSSSLQFDLAAGNTDDRFLLHFILDPLGVDDSQSVDNGIVIYSHDKTIYLVNEGEMFSPVISIYDIAGRVIYSESFIFDGSYMINLPSVESGVYLVNLSDGNSVRSQKVIIR